MHWLEKKFKDIRHSKNFKSKEWIWKTVRPVYNFYGKIFLHKGIERFMNGQDRILVAPECRDVPEVYEPEVWDHMMRRVHKGAQIVEVGAFIGLYTVAFGRRIGSDGRVFCFEPDPKNFNVLQKNIGLNKLESVALTYPMAVSDKCGKVVFQTGIGSESRLSFEGGQYGDRGTSIFVRCTTLDESFPDSSFDLLKIDVEGFEESVLMGGARLLSDSKRAPRHIYVEVHPFAWETANTTSESLLRLLRGHGYEVYFLNGSRVDKITEYGEIYCTKATTETDGL